MAFHHVALAVRDLTENHRFYTRPMGSDLAEVVVDPTAPGGRAGHVFHGRLALEDPRPGFEPVPEPLLHQSRRPVPTA